MRISDWIQTCALPILAHDDERRQHAEWQRDHRHQGRAQVPQEQGADHRDHEELFGQLDAEVAHRVHDQLGAVVHRADRSEESRVGKDCASTLKSRWFEMTKKKKTTYA